MHTDPELRHSVVILGQTVEGCHTHRHISQLTSHGAHVTVKDIKVIQQKVNTVVTLCMHTHAKQTSESNSFEKDANQL